MPTYRYETADENAGCAKCRAGFTVIHPMSGPFLEKCPDCGAAVSLAVCAPSIGRSKTDLDYRAKRAGFTKLQRTARGEYEKKY